MPVLLMLHLKFLLASHLTELLELDPCELDEDPPRRFWLGGKSLATQRSPASDGVRR